MSRISSCFEQLARDRRAAFIPFVMAGDPDGASSLELLKQLPAKGADLIEIGMAFSDPMADGPSVQLSGQRALHNQQTIEKTIELVRAFRKSNQTTPLILMGYFNPIFRFGVAAFVAEAKEAGVDGLIIVDLPPEADDELCLPAKRAGLDFIRLITPTSDEERLKTLLENASGFLYLVSVAGVTGTKQAEAESLQPLIAKIRQMSALPIAIGFGVKTEVQAKTLAGKAQAIVVASVLLDCLAKKQGETGKSQQNMADYLNFAERLAEAVHSAKPEV